MAFYLPKVQKRIACAQMFYGQEVATSWGFPYLAKGPPPEQPHRSTETKEEAWNTINQTNDSYQYPELDKGIRKLIRDEGASLRGKVRDYGWIAANHYNIPVPADNILSDPDKLKEWEDHIINQWLGKDTKMFLHGQMADGRTDWYGHPALDEMMVGFWFGRCSYTRDFLHNFQPPNKMTLALTCTALKCSIEEKIRNIAFQSIIHVVKFKTDKYQSFYKTHIASIEKAMNSQIIGPIVKK
ncbi:hypothetical protein SERLA73DRAFT_158344 [Serpula lacrymans var. lacrymans S7.3]|uniref:DUF6532 domain-containing protein n=1 Tax=Serpula lacrymans var. lacrymans (strain S7.3) TaxID=936435 RepID=F8PKT8_SERL3|nr:hypothetical protein SERLA73DRAFT_158344 [Serpula lacrymans var. lacrymans S7.3]